MKLYPFEVLGQKFDKDKKKAIDQTWFLVIRFNFKLSMQIN